ncbi:hypothetical protein LTR37_000445 [Vermiconidia calcicola]|uniref:Uncharacterized protein n=1 Tax=Vermiconidia calcicola TaxID=1690605 RepID=A0ACC3NYV5_9PEZI|nr:hypothetical protein LTR37_000445 [Vermiconidia calcicola]
MPKRGSTLQDLKDEDYDEGGPVMKRSRDSTSSQSQEPQQGSRTQRQAAAKCGDTLKGIAAEALSHVTPAKKQFPSSKHVPGSMDALRVSQRKRSSLAKNDSEEVKKLVDTSKAAEQEALLGTPDIILASSNALNITVHKLVQENGRLKAANTELVTANTRLIQDNDRMKKANAELATRVKTATQAKAKGEQDAYQANQDSEGRSSFLLTQVAEVQAQKNELRTKNKTLMEEKSGLIREQETLVARIKKLEAQVNSGKEQVAEVEKLRAEVKAKQALVDRYAKKISIIAGEAKLA